MKYRYEILVPLLLMGYVAFFPLANGDISQYFIKPNILLPFILVFLALTTLSFGVNQVAALGKALTSFFVKEHKISDMKPQTIDGAISYSYVSATLWVMYILVLSGELNFESKILISQIALAFTYSLILSELVLRPLKRRLEVISS